ncbi:hypothetical protein BT63DRAFT_324568 [Microthyrium microscopicum]|uniref:Uncharacterized protein n=1 Tax=Microthyrium microscopicum TaxID=703497 RepID=A0A6A6U5N4_9PEZI|nr:hypothetical protein BT63DRAFT_324568 [Microthyrium microscopicum]
MTDMSEEVIDVVAVLKDVISRITKLVGVVGEIRSQLPTVRSLRDLLLEIQRTLRLSPGFDHCLEYCKVAAKNYNHELKKLSSSSYIRLRWISSKRKLQTLSNDLESTKRRLALYLIGSRNPSITSQSTLASFSSRNTGKSFSRRSYVPPQEFEKPEFHVHINTNLSEWDNQSQSNNKVIPRHRSILYYSYRGSKGMARNSYGNLSSLASSMPGLGPIAELDGLDPDLDSTNSSTPETFRSFDTKSEISVESIKGATYRKQITFNVDTSELEVSWDFAMTSFTNSLRASKLN